MRVSVIGLVLLVCTVVLISGVSAQNVENNAGYSITPAGGLNLPSIMSPMTAGAITTGETDWYSTVVSPGTASLTTDLNWGSPSDSLTLTILAPDATLGPYYDISDGTLNGRITLVVSQAGGLTPGTWWFRVYGDRVAGSRGYNIVTY
jgi:hypothetical protein